MPRWLPISLFLLALAAAIWRAPMPVPAVFANSPITATTTAPTNSSALAAETAAAGSAFSTLPAEFFSEKISEANGNIGASSLARLPDGRLMLAWQESRTDDASDNTIRLLAQDKQGNWGKAKDIANRPVVAGSSFSYLSQLGRPLLYAEGNWLHLWLVSHAVSDWRSAAIIHRFSSDAGNSWSPAQKMAIAPGFNDGALHLAPPVLLDEGDLALPLQESRTTQSWLRIAATGQILDKLRLQPGQILLPQGPVAVNLPEGSKFVLPLSASNLLAAGHPAGNPKILQLWLSKDAGEHWQASRIIEQADDGAAEFTHPFLLLGSDQRIHLTYTWRRQSLKHLRFTAAWLSTEVKP
jgi:predicted neuraminidase